MEMRRLGRVWYGLVAGVLALGSAACERDVTAATEDTSPLMHAGGVPFTVADIQPGRLVVCVYGGSGLHRFSVPEVHAPTFRTMGTHMRIESGRCAVVAGNNDGLHGHAVVRRWDEPGYRLLNAQVFQPGQNGELETQTHAGPIVGASISATHGVRMVFHVDTH